MNAQLDTARIAFIGGGNMARSLIGGLLKQGVAPDRIDVAEPGEQAREALQAEFGVICHVHSHEAVMRAGIIVLAVKPQVMPAVGLELRALLPDRQPLLVSIAAGVRLDQLARWFGAHLPIVRCMPNTPAMLGVGATGLCANERVDASQRALAQVLLDAVGVTCWLEQEALLDTVTALSGSGPAYFFLLAEAMEEAAVAQGLPREAARLLASQTCLGAGRMLVDAGEDAAQLRRRVTSPKGTTQAALESLIADGLPQGVARAMAAAAHRAGELADALD